MIDFAAITKALTAQLETYLATVSTTGPRPYTVKRSAYLNHDPAITPWVGVYRSKIDYEPRALGSGSGQWRVNPEIKIAVQASSRKSGDQAEDRLEDYVKDVIDGVLSDHTIGGTVQIVSGFSIAYTYNEAESETLFFHMAEITLTTQTRTS